MTTVLSIDPGTKESGWAEWNVEGACAVRCGHEDNDTVRRLLRRSDADIVVIETPAPGGLHPWGHDMVQTCLYAGKLVATAEEHSIAVVEMPRTQVRLTIIGRASGNDTMVNQALRGLLCERHGCDEKALKGKKRDPGPCYGANNHIWAAIALAVTWQIQTGSWTTTSGGESK